ncbi:MAG: AMIN domain-containing protein, partial [Desulfobulbaceae bacterium]|nr:AMIN domain-containing protein [Desulfobulbaceae bacterium]
MQHLPKTLQYPSWIALLLFFVSSLGFAPLSIQPTDALAQDAATDKEYEEAGVVVTAVDWEEQEDEYLVWIEFSSIPAYTIYALSNPSRIIVDLENTAFEDHLSFPMQVDIGPIAYIKGREYSTRQPVLARLAVYLQGERPDIEVAEEDYEVLIFIPKPPQAEPEQEETAPEEENQQKEEYQPEETAPKSPESAAGPEVAQEEQKTGDSPKTADQTASLPPEVPKEEPPLSQTAELPTTPLPAEDAAQTASTSAPQEPEIEDKIVEEIIEEKE